MESASALWGVCWDARESSRGAYLSLALTLTGTLSLSSGCARGAVVAHRVPLWLFYLVLYIVRDVVDICIF